MIRGSGSWSLLAWIISFTILTTIAVLLRFWSARIQNRKFFFDDGFVIISYTAMLTQQAVGLWGLINGAGNPSSEFTAPELIVQAKVLVAVSTTWAFSTTFIKLAVLTLYMRIFTTAIFKRWAISLMAFVVSFGITFFIVFLTRCNPVSQEWAPVPWGRCTPVIVTELSSISTNLVLDTAIVVLPMPWLWHLQMPLSNKIVVTVMFSFGFATIAIMAYRIEQTVHGNPDPTLAAARTGLLSNLELWLGIIVACLPTMAPFFRAYVQPQFSSISRKLYKSTSSSDEPGTPRAPLRTFGNSGATGPKGQRSYAELSETYIDLTEYREEVRLVVNERPDHHIDGGASNINGPPGITRG